MEEDVVVARLWTGEYGRAAVVASAYVSLDVREHYDVVWIKTL